MINYRCNELKFSLENVEEAFSEKLQEEKDYMKKLIAYMKDESGQTSTEYILLVAVVAMIVFKFKKTADTQLTAITEGVFGKAKTMVDGINVEQ